MVIVGLGFLQVLQSVLNFIFEKVLQPVLTDVLNVIINVIGTLISQALSKLILQCWVVMLKLVAFFEDIFNVFTGLSDIRVDDVSQGKGFLDYLFTLPAVQQAVLAITLISFVFIFFVSMMAVLRSMSDMVLENKNPLSQVLRDSLKGALTIVLIPSICLFGLMVSSNIMLIIHNEFNLGVSDDADISDLVFITVASSHIKNPTKLEAYSSGHAYTDVDAIVRDFNTADFNYCLLFISTFFITFILFTTIIQSIMRIFVILLLYIVSPLIAVMMPLDGGKKFNDWKKMFLAYTISAFSPLLAMKLYFMIMASVFSSSNPVVFTSSDTINTVIEIMLISGGAYAVYSSRNLLVTLVDPSAAGLLGSSGGLLSFGLGKLSGAVTSKMKGR
ncbi:MAG: hypothetical protein R3Y07_04445 [Eubacteriales bacterium]